MAKLTAKATFRSHAATSMACGGARTASAEMGSGCPGGNSNGCGGGSTASTTGRVPFPGTAGGFSAGAGSPVRDEA